MKPHTKLYFNSLGFDESDFISCEICSAQAVDVHHIEARGMGGSSKKDNIFNLMAVCRLCHDKYGDKKQYMEGMKVQHLEFLMQRGVNILGVYQQVNFNENQTVFIK